MQSLQSSIKTASMGVMASFTVLSFMSRALCSMRDVRENPKGEGGTEGGGGGGGSVAICALHSCPVTLTISTSSYVRGSSLPSLFDACMLISSRSSEKKKNNNQTTFLFHIILWTCVVDFNEPEDNGTSLFIFKVF